jgi:hypothetical protein
VATVHDVIKKIGQELPRPSVIFHAYASVDTLWVAQTLSHCTPVKRGKDIIQLVDTRSYLVWGFHMPCMLHYISKACSFRHNQHRRGLSPWSSKFLIQTTLILPIQYSLLYPNCPARYHIKPFYQLFMFSTFQKTNQGIKSPKSHEWNLPLHFSQSSIC